MNREQLINGFQFDYEAALKHNIQTITAVQFHTLVRYWQCLLPLEFDTGKREFMAETFFIRGFQKPRPEMAMYLDARSDNLLGEFIETPRLRVSAVYVHASIHAACGLAAIFC